VERLNGHENVARLEPENIGPLPRANYCPLRPGNPRSIALKGAANAAFRSDPRNELG
jgi:hypothetical protein